MKNKNNATEFAVQRMIDSVWTIEFKRVPGGVEILRYSRDIDEGYEHEDTLSVGVINEDEERTVLSITFYPPKTRRSERGQPKEVLKVLNPKHVFDYGA